MHRVGILHRSQESVASNAAAAYCIELIGWIGSSCSEGELLTSKHSLLLALFMIAALHSPTAVSACKFTAASVDVPVVHYGMPTLPRASQCSVSRPKQVSQPIELREVATCHSVQRREAKAGVAINRTASAIAFDFGEANPGCTTLALALRSL
jgi:hypothetical protein